MPFPVMLPCTGLSLHERHPSLYLHAQNVLGFCLKKYDNNPSKIFTMLMKKNKNPLIFLFKCIHLYYSYPVGLCAQR